MDKILSIIIPTYNMEKYLSKCLDSLLIPSIDKLDIIVVNDGSKDSSSAIAHEYADKYPTSIRVIDKENGNYGSCINAAIPEIKGKYVKILDADDSFITKNLDLFINELLNSDADCIITDFIITSPNKSTVQKISFSNLPSNIILRPSDILNSSYLNVTMHALTYKSKILKENHYVQTEGISYTDQEWSLIPSQWITTYNYLDIDIYSYLLGREGQTMLDQAHKRINIVSHIIHQIINRYLEGKTITTENDTLFIYKVLECHANLIRDEILYDKNLNNLDKISFLDNNLKKFPQPWLSIENKNLHKLIPIKYIKLLRNNNFKNDLIFKVIRLFTLNLH